MSKDVRTRGFIILLAWLTAVLFIPRSGRAADSPQWLQAYHEGTLNLDGKYYGVGSAEFIGEKPDYESQRLSKDRALDELCYQLSVAVKSQLTESLSQKGNFSEQQVASSLFVSTRKVQSGVQEKSKWTDPNDRQYWVMVIIDKAEADRQVKQQDFVKEVVDRLEKKQQEIMDGIKSMTAVMNQHMKINEKRMKNVEGLLTTINDKVGSAGSQTQAEYAAIKGDIQKIEQQWQKQEALLGSQNARMEALMRQNETLAGMFAKLSENIHKDQFLALAQDDVKNKTAQPQFEVRIAPLKGQGADYFEGESIQFRVTANRDCFIKVIYLSSIGVGQKTETRVNTLLFPNMHDRNNRLRANQSVVIGRQGELIVQPPFGKDIVTVVASPTQFSDIGELLDKAEGRYYSEVTANTRGVLQLRSRGIGVARQLDDASVSDKPAFASDTCFIVSHKK
jgi:hypothetical protein